MGPKEGVDRVRGEIELIGRPPSPGQPPRSLQAKEVHTHTHTHTHTNTHIHTHTHIQGDAAATGAGPIE
jgi:hypothetical protein